MKKRWIPFVLVCLVLTFVLGMQRGSMSEFQLQQTRISNQKSMQTTIAVVNADTGIVVDGVTQNFSTSLIETLESNYTLVSSVMAFNGYANGVYGAIVTFPSNVSEKILSYNSTKPEKVQLEFQVNPLLSEKEYIETYMKILDLQLQINTSLTYTYVSSIYQQFHQAQDYVNDIFKNDSSDLTALQTIKLENFTDPLEFDELPEISLEPKRIDTAPHTERMNPYVNNVSTLFLNSYGEASSSYLTMREDLLKLTDNFPNQEDDWLANLSDWTEISVEYGEKLATYSDSVQEFEDNMLSWYEEVVQWNKLLIKYQEDILLWHDSGMEWFGDATGWYDQYQMYLDDAVSYMDEVGTYRSSLTDSIDPVLQDMEDWNTLLEEYAHSLHTLYEAYTSSGEDYEEQYGNINDYLGALEEWHTELSDWQSDLTGWGDELTQRKDDLNAWQDDLSTWGDEIQTWEDGLGMWHSDLELWQDGLFIWKDDLDVYYDDLDTWYSDATDWNTELQDWQNDLVDFREDLTDRRQDIIDWRDELNTSRTELVILISDLHTRISELSECPNPSSYANEDAYKAALLDWQIELQAFAGFLSYPLTLTMAPENQTTIPTVPIVPDITEPELPVIPEPVLPELEEPDIPSIVPPDYSYLEDLLEGPVEPPLFDEEFNFSGSLILPGWSNSTLDAPDPYSGRDIPAELAAVFPEPGTKLPNEPGLLAPDDYNGSEFPKMVELWSSTILNQPNNPLVDSPPRPDTFWASLDDMHNQLMTFHVDNYLSEEIKKEVAFLLVSYGEYLNGVGEDLTRQFDDNILKMDEVYFGYRMYLSTLRMEAFQTHSAEQEKLNAQLNTFFAIKEENSTDTQNRLTTFAGMVPESRTSTGINKTLVDFTVSPFVFIPPTLRPAEEIQLVASDVGGNHYNPFLWIVIAVAVLVFLATIASYLLVNQKKKRLRGRGN